jgi:hypothetical protein
MANVSGQWTIIQGNTTVALNIQPARPDGSFVLTASHTNGSVSGGGFGSLRDGLFTLRITWTNNTEGVYTGVFDEQGFLHGGTFDVRHPTSVASWKSSRSFL